MSPYCLGEKLDRGDDSLVNRFGGPAADSPAAMRENLRQPDDPGVMDFDAGITDGAGGDGQGDLLRQGKVHMNFEALSLEAGCVKK